MTRDDHRESTTNRPMDTPSPPHLPAISGIRPRQPPTLPPGPLVGREKDLARLHQALFAPDARTVSVLGPGGVGKTRLALAVAHTLAATFADGVLWIPLDRIDADSLWEAIGRQFSLTSADGNTWMQRVCGYLGQGQFLTVLDNCESMPEIADDLPELLTRCTGVKALLTSRETLRLPGDHEIWLDPLTLPDQDPGSDTETGSPEENPAVHLFTLRARQVYPDFVVTSANRGTVHRIVQRLDGLPLAIELAAASMRHLSLEEVLQMIDEALSSLSGGPRTLPDRHHSLREMVRRSLDSLSPHVRTDTLRLAVFTDGFTPDTVGRVIDSGSRHDAWKLLLSLADRSIVTRVPTRQDTRARFTMLQTIRSVVREELEASPDLFATTLHRQANALVDVAREADRHYHGPEGLAWLQRMRRDHIDIHAVISQSLTRPDLGRMAIELCGDMFWFWYTQGHHQWALVRVENLLDLAGESVSQTSRARAHVTAGWLAHRMAQFERANRHFTAARELFGPKPERGSLLGDIGYAYILSHDRRDTSGAMRLLDAVADQARSVPNAWHEEAAGHFGIGLLQYFDGDYQPARERFNETIRLGRAYNDGQSIGMSLMYLAHVDRAEGAPAEAFWKLREALPLLMEIGDLATAALLLDIVASTLVELDAHELAMQALAVGEHLRAKMSIPRSPLELPDAEATRQRINSALAPGVTPRTLDLGVTIDRLLRFQPGTTPMAESADRPAGPNLSPRELEVLHLIATGMTSSEIAAALFVSPHTVKRHMANIRKKLGVRSQAAAIAALRDQG
jgi:predicted ATPase/DNA-binding CsgD family transcriptional regulator